jgi:hypothetical protein
MSINFHIRWHRDSILDIPALCAADPVPENTHDDWSAFFPKDC